MSRFYVSKESVKGNQILISGKEAHHILDVMRLKVSDQIVVFDGTGKEYIGKVKEASRKSLSLEIIKERDAVNQERYGVTLIQAIPKKDKMDYIVEKATELGVGRVIPITTARTIPDWNESKKAGIVERWQKIAQEAAKQCGRAILPEIGQISTLEEAVRNIDGYNPKLIAALSDKAVKLKDALKNCPPGNIIAAIGPEGDFTPEEIDFANGAGFKTISLGPRVLKSDTAALALLAMINYEYQ
jgi:16S rRNA (uracil1498-N3)-methyltransferase